MPNSAPITMRKPGPTPRLWRPQQPGAQPHAVVVGAGLAGLAAAEHLLREAFDNTRTGVRVTVLEASPNKLGGRVHTHDEVGRPPLELGPEFVDGPASAPTYWALARQADLETQMHLARPQADAWLRRDALSPISPLGEDAILQRRAAYDDVLNYLRQEAPSYDQPGADPPWCTSFYTALDKQSLADWAHTHRDLRGHNREALDAALWAVAGTSPSSASALGCMLAVGCTARPCGWRAGLMQGLFGGAPAPELYRCGRGQGALIEHLAESIDEFGGDVRRGCEVTQICFGENPRVFFRHSGRTGGANTPEELVADFIVCAVPPRARGKIRFEPRRPISEQEEAQMAHAAKVAAPWHADAGPTSYLLWDAERLLAMGWSPDSERAKADAGGPEASVGAADPNGDARRLHYVGFKEGAKRDAALGQVLNPLFFYHAAHAPALNLTAPADGAARSGQSIVWPTDGAFASPAVGELTGTGVCLLRGYGHKKGYEALRFAGDSVPVTPGGGSMEVALASGRHAAAKILDSIE